MISGLGEIGICAENIVQQRVVVPQESRIISGRLTDRYNFTQDSAVTKYPMYSEVEVPTI